MIHVRQQIGSPENLLDDTLKTQLGDWLSERQNLFPAQLAPVLVRLDAFAAGVHDEDVESMMKILGTGSKNHKTTTELVAAIASGLARDRSATRGEALHKSLEEVFFYTTGVDCDQSPSEFGKKLKGVLGLLGSRGLIRLFLQFHLFNVIWLEVQDALQAAAKDLMTVENQMEDLQRVSVAAVDMSTREMKKWPELDPPAAENLVRSVEFAVADLAGYQKRNSPSSFAATATRTARRGGRQARRL
jgi:hypothetical protein